MFICLNLGLFWVIYLRKVRSLGHRPLIVKRVVTGVQGGWKLSTKFMLSSVSCLVNNKHAGKKIIFNIQGYVC